MQNRFKSKLAWLAVVAVFVLLADNYGLWNSIGMTSEVFQKMIDGIFGVLTAFGIFNNPTNVDNY